MPLDFLWHVFLTTAGWLVRGFSVGLFVFGCFGEDEGQYVCDVCGCGGMGVLANLT
jgi:hypothetical protein